MQAFYMRYFTGQVRHYDLIISKIVYQSVVTHFVPEFVNNGDVDLCSSDLLNTVASYACTENLQT